MFGPCKSCVDKQSHIDSLSKQVQTLEKLLFPQRPTQDVTLSDQEVDSLMSPNDVVFADDEINREASALLSGEYDTLHEEL